jgi:hypothetical protein
MKRFVLALTVLAFCSVSFRGRRVTAAPMPIKPVSRGIELGNREFVGYLIVSGMLRGDFGVQSAPIGDSSLWSRLQPT